MKLSERPLIAHTRRLFSAERRALVRLVATSIVRSLATVATVLLVEQFLSGVLGKQAGLARDLAELVGPGTALWLIAGLLLVSYILSSLANYDNQLTQQKIARSLELRTMERLLSKVLSLSLPYFERQSHADIIQAVRNDINALRSAVLGAASIVIDLVVLVGLSMTVVTLSPNLSFWVLVALPLMAIPVFLVARRTLALSERSRRRGNSLFDALLEVLRGIRVIRAFQAEEAQERLSLERGRLFFEDQIAISQLRFLSAGILEILAGLSLVVVILVGGYEVMAGRLDWAALLAFIMAVRALNNPIRAITSNYLQIRASSASLTRIDEIMVMRPEIADGPEPMPEAPASLTFEHVGFSYGQRAVLHDLSFEARAGETIGIAGPSGAGKTTLLSLLVRFYDPTGGRVRWGPHDLQSVRLEDVYAKVAIVSQEPFLFATSVRDNIRVGRPDATDAEVEEAARLAAVHEDILAFERGYDTQVGLGGARVSGGQAQRIDIARALLKGAPILVLDEATAHLDSLTEAKVQEALAHVARVRLTFIVAHRLSTMRHATRILVLDEGRIVGFAPHDELVVGCDLYRRMWEAQRLEARRVVSPIAPREVAEPIDTDEPDPLGPLD